jgi:hypothetical protein
VNGEWEQEVGWEAVAQFVHVTVREGATPPAISGIGQAGTDNLLRFVILGLDPRIHAGTLAKGRAGQKGCPSPAASRGRDIQA